MRSADQTALAALSDALADAARAYEAGAEAADKNRPIAQQLSEDAATLRRLSDTVRARAGEEDEAGTAFQFVGDARLLVNRLFDDADEAACRSSIAARRDLLAFIDDYRASPDLSPQVIALFDSVRAEVAAPDDGASPDDGLANLPR